MDWQLIVAVSENDVIGHEGSIPWSYPEDMKHFRKYTSGKTVLMGRRTWESLPGPLKNRTNIVLTSDLNYVAEGAITYPSLSEFASSANNVGPVVVIGGAGLYQDTIASGLVTEVVITHIHKKVVGDTRLRINLDGWYAFTELRSPDFDIVRYTKYLPDNTTGCYSDERNCN